MCLLAVIVQSADPNEIEQNRKLTTCVLQKGTCVSVRLVCVWPKQFQDFIISLAAVAGAVSVSVRFDSAH